MMALRMGRRGRGVELNPGYFLDSVKYLEAEERSGMTRHYLLLAALSLSGLLIILARILGGA